MKSRSRTTQRLIAVLLAVSGFVSGCASTARLTPYQYTYAGVEVTVPPHSRIDDREGVDFRDFRMWGDHRGGWEYRVLLVPGPRSNAEFLQQAIDAATEVSVENEWSTHQIAHEKGRWAAHRWREFDRFTAIISVLTAHGELEDPRPRMAKWLDSVKLDVAALNAQFEAASKSAP